MVRVEKHVALEQRLENVKGEVVREVRRRTRHRRPWLTCALLFLAFVLAVGVWMTWMVASTGLVRIPVFTSLAYQTPSPTRPVTAGVLVETVAQETFTSTLTRRLYEGSGELTNRSVQLLLSEASLTASLRSFLEEGGMDWIDTSQVQVVVDPEIGIELFIPLSRSLSDLGTAVVAIIDPEVADDRLAIHIRELRVGSAIIPDVLVTAFLAPVLEAELDTLNDTLAGYARITAVELLPRELSLTGELSVEIREAL